MNFTNGRFYIIDAESGENRGSVVFDSYDEGESFKADNKMCAARELLARSLEMLYLLGYDSGFTNPAINALTYDIEKFLEEKR